LRVSNRLPRDLDPAADAPCLDCARRGWLLAKLSGLLEHAGRSPTRLLDLLKLSDEELVRAVGGTRREELLDECARFDTTQVCVPPVIETICMHDSRYPWTRESVDTPRLLYVAGGVERLQRLLSEPVVAIVGTRRPTSYGLEVARGLARGLSVSGVTVVSALAEGIPVAVHEGASEGGGSALTAAPGGVDLCYPASRRDLYRRMIKRGCAVSELPAGVSARGWCHLARQRVVVGLAQLVIVVEAGERPAELLPSRFAEAMGRTVAAVPGRVTSPVSTGTNAMLARGAHLVRDVQDALDLVYGLGERRAPETRPVVEARLQVVLDQVGAGRDTLAKLEVEGRQGSETLIALAELELIGALKRTGGGRYVPGH
jgi:DNA processing protein